MPNGQILQVLAYTLAIMLRLWEHVVGTTEDSEGGGVVLSAVCYIRAKSVSKARDHSFPLTAGSGGKQVAKPASSVKPSLKSG